MTKNISSTIDICDYLLILFVNLMEIGFNVAHTVR